MLKNTLKAFIEMIINFKETDIISYLKMCFSY